MRTEPQLGACVGTMEVVDEGPGEMAAGLGRQRTQLDAPPNDERRAVRAGGEPAKRHALHCAAYDTSNLNYVGTSLYINLGDI